MVNLGKQIQIPHETRLLRENQEWKHRLRSALFPTLLAVIYRAASAVCDALSIASHTKAEVLLAAPKVLQAIIAAVGDYYTVKLAQHVYGKRSAPANCALLLTVGSAWNWFVSTRTFSNCTETTLTIVALYNWPYHWALGVDEVGFQAGRDFLRLRQPAPAPSKEKDVTKHIDETIRLRRALLCAGLAVILRPTNAIVWLTLIIATFGRGIYQFPMIWEIEAFLKESVLCGASVLFLSSCTDRYFYDEWTFPLWYFFKFNIVQSLAVFYGNNDWHYYISQGYPLLLTAAIPYALTGLAAIFRGSQSTASLTLESRMVLHRLALVGIILPAILSILAHKEVRFIYPILPTLHVIAALPMSSILGFPQVIGKAIIRSPNAGTGKPLVAILLFLVPNILIAGYFSIFHNSGLLMVTDYLRNEFETNHLSFQPESNLTFAVLMPCHSTPWRSHLQYPPTQTQAGISGWALTCEPPLDLSLAQKEKYKDEADYFYLNPAIWIKQNMVQDVPKGPGVYAQDPTEKKKLWSNPIARTGLWLNEGEGGQETGFFRRRKRAWPDHLLFFGELEPKLQVILRGSAYQECARFPNSLFHDDWRRRGDVVVWCLRNEKNDRRGKLKAVDGNKSEL